MNIFYLYHITLVQTKGIVGAIHITFPFSTAGIYLNTFKKAFTCIQRHTILLHLVCFMPVYVILV